MLGAKFRELRQKAKISMAEASQGITSRSSLQRWESGQGQMSIEKVGQLLARIHIQPEEYLYQLGRQSLQIYTQGVEQAYANNDVATLRAIALRLLKKHLQDKSNRQLLFQTAVACNFYFDLSNVDLFPSAEKIRLKSYFLAVDDWSVENVLLFANVLLLLAAEDVYLFARELLSYLVDQTNSKQFYVMSVDALLNAIFVLIKKKQVDQACQLLRQVKELQVPEKYSRERIRIKFMQALIKYIKSGDDSAFKEFIKSLRFLGFQQQANDFKFTFKQIKGIY